MIRRKGMTQQRLVAICALVCCLLALFVPSRAFTQGTFTSLELTITDTNFVPIPRAKLCVSMPNQRIEREADQNGRYVMTLPPGQTTVYVKKEGYANKEETFSNTGEPRLVRTLRLDPGQSQPFPIDCGTTQATVTEQGNACDQILEMRAAGQLTSATGPTVTSRTVPIDILFREWPNAYRIREFTAQERWDMSHHRRTSEDIFRDTNPPWQTFPAQPPDRRFRMMLQLTETHYGIHSVYAQTRRFSSGCVSRPHPVSFILAPTNFQNYVLEGRALDDYVAEAKRRGYQFRTTFEFRPKDSFWLFCKANEMLEPKNPSIATRARPPFIDKATVDEKISASFEVFDGPNLNWFWELKDMRAFHPELPAMQFFSKTFPSDEPALDFTLYSVLNCAYCTQQDIKDLHRVIAWERRMWRTVNPTLPNPKGETICKARTFKEPHLVRLEIRGPAGENPINALGDLRETRAPANIRPIPPPRIVVPRGLGEEGATEGNQPVDPPPGGEMKP